LQRGLAFAPVVGAKRVFIVTRADTLTSAAANSLLKVLEEPPPYAVFILLAPNASRLLPTILSRCRIVRCLPAPIDDLAAYLEASRQIDPERARSLAALAEGRTGEALRLSSDPVRMEAIRAVTCLGLQLPGAGLVRSLKLSEALRKAGAAPKSLSEAGPEENGGEPVRDRAARGQLGATLDRLLAVYRDLLHASVAGDEAPLVHIEASEDLLRVGGSRPPASWMRDIETLSRARERLERNVSLALLSDWLAVELGR
jgi:DNA polymerase-3 subunit delta'